MGFTTANSVLCTWISCIVQHCGDSAHRLVVVRLNVLANVGVLVRWDRNMHQKIMYYLLETRQTAIATVPHHIWRHYHSCVDYGHA